MESREQLQERLDAALLSVRVGDEMIGLAEAGPSEVTMRLIEDYSKKVIASLGAQGVQGANDLKFKQSRKSLWILGNHIAFMFVELEVGPTDLFVDRQRSYQRMDAANAERITKVLSRYDDFSRLDDAAARLYSEAVALAEGVGLTASEILEFLPSVRG